MDGKHISIEEIEIANRNVELAKVLTRPARNRETLRIDVRPSKVFGSDSFLRECPKDSQRQVE